MKKNSSFIIGIPAVVWQISFFYIPLLFVVFSSLIRHSLDKNISFTLDNFLHLGKWFYLQIIFNSFILATVVACICILLAYPFSYFVTFCGKRFKNLYLFFLIVPFWTNFLLHVYAWFYVLEKNGVINHLLQSMGIIKTPIPFLNSPFAIILMMVYYYLPFTVIPIYSALERFDHKLLEASLNLGASFNKTFLKILLPITMPGVRTAFFLAFIPSFGEFIIPELMGGDKTYFVGNVLTLFVLGEGTEGLAAAFTIMSTLALLVAAGLFYWLIHCLFKQPQNKHR